MAQVKLNQVWAETGGKTDPGDAKYKTGWQAEIPTFQDFNYLLNSMDSNIKQLATQASFDWEATIEYLPGAQVLLSGATFYALVVNTNVNPSTDTLGVTWSRAPVIGSETHAHHKNAGLYVYRPGVDNYFTWSSSTMTLDDSAPLIFFKSTNLSNTVTNPGYLLGNLHGEMCIVDADRVGEPDGRTLALADNHVHKVVHEGNIAQILSLNPGIIKSDIPIGTIMVFVQAAVPVGWSLTTQFNDRMMRLSDNGAAVGGNHDPVSWTHSHGGFTTDQRNSRLDESNPDHDSNHRNTDVHNHAINADSFTPKYVNTITCIKS